MKFIWNSSRNTPPLTWMVTGGYWMLSTVYFPALCLATWEIDTEEKIFHTDDVAVFSASQRLSADEDPTQPTLDITDQGEDWVFEPQVVVSHAWATGWGQTRAEAQGQGFIFADQSSFNHATLGVSLTQELPHQSQLKIRYHFGPNLFLGRNIEKRSGAQLGAKEKVTTHFGAATLEHAFFENLNGRILARYGIRLYNPNFSQRDTHFWTIGPHLKWNITPSLEWFLGYHFERGLAKGRNSETLKDDVSYVNHYMSSELEWRPGLPTSIGLAFHYERNLFTSDVPEDERNGAHEDVIQGDLEIRQQLRQGITLIIGFQHSERKASFDNKPIFNTNLWMGGHYTF